MIFLMGTYWMFSSSLEEDSYRHQIEIKRLRLQQAERQFEQTLRRTERQLDRARTIAAATPPPTVEQEVEKLRAQLFPN
jgi:hypothetical protein